MPDEPLTLAIDIGGSHLKAGVLTQDVKMIAGPDRVDTPRPANPQSVIQALLSLVSPMDRFDRISIGFPGVVRAGAVLTAPNLGTPAWRGYPLAAELSRELGRPARMSNDATIQGLGVIEGHGTECVLTLGTGMGFALFQAGIPAPHLEMGQHIARKRRTYDAYVGNAALHRIGRKHWNRRMRRVLDAMFELVTPNRLYLGGGNAELINFELGDMVRLVPNTAGISGGVRLWEGRIGESWG